MKNGFLAVFSFFILSFFLFGQSDSKPKISPSGFITKNNSNYQVDIRNTVSEVSTIDYSSRDLDGTTVSIIDVVDKYDGTVDIIVNVDTQSPDDSYIDAARYTFPEGLIINSGYSETMPASTSSAVCDVVIDQSTNSITFGDASYIDDPNSGTGYGCFNIENHQHIINVDLFTNDIEIGFYLSDDCYQSCGDIEGQMTVPGINIPFIPPVSDVSIIPGEGQVTLSWDAPPTEFNNQDIAYDNNSINDYIYMSAGEAIVGTFFRMPGGSNESSVGSIDIYGSYDLSGQTELYGYNVVNGIPEDTAVYSIPITTVMNEWTNVELDWSFNGDFLIGIKISTTIAISMDNTVEPSSQSWIYLNGWATWNSLALSYGLTDGEFGIRAKNVTANGVDVDYLFNVYKGENNEQLTLLSQEQSSLYYIDQNIEDGVDQCYSVTAFNFYESGFSPVVCYNTNDGYEQVNATVTFAADLSNIVNFDPLFHTIEVRGSWDQWSSGHYMQSAGGYFYANIDINGSPGQIMEWQFKAGPDEVWLNNGWEQLDEPRAFVFTGQNIDFSDPFNPDIISWEESLIPEFSLADSWGLPGDTVAVEFSFSSGNDLFSMNSFEVSFNDASNENLEFIGIDTSNSVTGEAYWLTSTNIENNRILVAAAGSQAITESGTLFKLKFAIDPDFFPMADDFSFQLALQDFMVNELVVYDSQDEPVTGSIYIPECNTNYVTIFCDNGNYQDEVSWTLYNSSNDAVATGGAPFYIDTCLPDDGYTLQMFDSYGDGWNGVMWGVYDIVSDTTLAYTSMDTGSTATFEFYIGDYEQLAGCMDPSAINYDPTAVFNDGSCLYEGDICSVALPAVEGDDGNSADGSDEWFYYTATMDGFLTITTCYEYQFEDTDLTVFSSCPSDGGYEISTNDDAYCGLVTGGNDYGSELTISVDAGETYYIFWDDTWSPLPFVWYMYETTPQSAPSNLTAIPGPGSIILDWDPMPVEVLRNTNYSALEQLSVGEDYSQSLSKKDLINSVRPYRAPSQSRTTVGGYSESKMLWIERTGRNTSVMVNLYDSYGDGYDGNGYLETENGEQIAIFPAGNWGEQISYGPYDLADGIYTIYFEEASWMGETSWDITDSENNVISSGSVSSFGYFGIGDVDVPIADIAIDSLWYDQAEDIISVSLSNIGTGYAGGFYLTYFLANELDNSCGNENYEVWSYIDSLPIGSSVITSSPFGINEYLGGYGVYSVSVSADHWCAVSELDESNNVLTQDINIIDPLEGVSWNIYKQESGNDFSIAFIADEHSFVDSDVLLDIDYCYYVTQVRNEEQSDASDIECASPLEGNIILEPYPFISFSDTKAGMGSAGQTVTITNGSDNPSILIQSISIVGQNVEDFSIDYLGNTMPINVTDNITVDVLFTPLSVGEKSAQLLVYSSSENSSMQISLSGRAYLSPPSGLSAIGFDSRVDLAWDSYNLVPQGSGDVIGSPFMVTSLPFTSFGTTVGFEDDYDVSCPYTGAGSPDVVYEFDSPGGNFDISLCESGYDTKLYIYDSLMDTVGCNDDLCSNSLGDQYRSLLENISLDQGTYYIIVDGYGDEAGEYQLEIDYHSNRSFDIAADDQSSKVGVTPTYYKEYQNTLVPYYSAPMGHDMTATVENNSRDNYQIDYYKIYRTSNPNTTNESFSLISTISAGEQNIFSDLQVENETRYYYKMTAVESTYGESDFSNIIDAMPLQSFGLPYYTDFESDNGGFNTLSGSGFILWEWGSATAGPESALSGNNVWGTNLDGGYPDNSQQLMFNVFNLTSSPYPVFLNLSIWHELEDNADYLRLLIDHDNDGMWDLLESFTGESDGWENVTLSIPEEYRTPYTRIGLLLESDDDVHGLGAYIDDFSIIASNPPIITTQSDDLIDAIEDQIYSVDIAFTDADGGEVENYLAEIVGPAANWLSVNGIWNVGGSNYIINLLGSPDDENLFESTFSVSVIDENGLQSSASFSLTIIATNDKPLIVGFNGDTLFYEDTQFELDLFDFIVEDPDNTFPGDFSAQGLSVGQGNFYLWDGQFIIPGNNYNGPLSVPVSVNDGSLDSDVFILELNVMPENDPPVIITTSEDFPEVIEDLPYSAVVDFTDVDGPEDVNDFTINLSGSASEWLEIDSSSSLGFGIYRVMLAGVADDSDLLSDVLNISISDGENETVADYVLTLVATNDPGHIVGFAADTSFNEDTQFAISVFDFIVEDPDNIFPGDYVNQGVSVGEGDNFSWNGENIVPDEDYNGPLFVPLTLSDGTDETNLFILNLFVLPINDAPVIMSPAVNLESDEDQEIVIVQEMFDIEDMDGENNFVVNVEDGENYNVLGQNIVLPFEDYNGLITIPVSVQDASGAFSNVFPFSVVVLPVNDAPEIVAVELNPSIPDLEEDIVLSYVFFDVDGDDESGTIITWFKDGVEQVELQGQTTISGGLTLCDESWYAVVTPSDGVLIGQGSSTPEAIICGNNTPPVWTSEELVFSIDEDQEGQIISFADYVSDSEQSISQLLFYVYDNSDTVNLGASFTGSDLYLSTLVENYFATESIILGLVADDQLGYSDTIMVSISIDPINDGPIITAYTGMLELDEDSSIVIDLGDISVQDVDNVYPDDFLLTIVDGDHYTISSDSIVSPDQNFNGDITVPVIVNDGELSSDLYEVVLTVNPVNDAPVILAQLTMSTVEDSSFTVTLEDLVYEDVDNIAADLSILLGDGENYTVESTTVTPSTDYIGILSIPAYLYDGTDTSEVAFTLEVEVLGVNDAPILVSGIEDITVDEDSDTQSFSLISNNGNAYFDDIDIAYGDLLSYEVEELDGGLLMITVDGDSVHIDFMSDSSGSEMLYVTATDLSGLSATDTIIVNVNPVNDAPVITGVLTEFSMLEDESITVGLADIQVVDVDSDNFTMSILEGENYTISNLTVTPTANFNGNLTVPVVVSDGQINSEAFSLSILVEAVNDTPLGFSLLSPENGSSVTILMTDLIAQSTLEVSWSESVDPDGEGITYGLEMLAGDWSSVIVSGLPDTTYNLPYAIITAILDTLNASELSIDWTVFSTDGIDTVFADQVFSFQVDAYDVLSTEEVLIPEVYALHQNYPNPFNPTTTVKYDLPEAAVVNIRIFDVLGREVISLMDNIHQNPGYKSIRWNGLNHEGKQVVSGMYFYVIKTEKFSQTRKMLMIK